MDKLVENATQFSEILQSSTLPEVVNWKTEDLERAFHWAEYFKKVQGRLSQKQSILQRLDDHLKQLGKTQLCKRFGREEFSCAFLEHSSEFLVKALLENPVLPAELRERILAEYVRPDSPLFTHRETFARDATLLRTLSLMHSKLTSAHCSTTVSTDTPSELLTVDAIILQDDVHWQLQGSIGSSGTSFVRRSQVRGGLGSRLVNASILPKPHPDYSNGKPAWMPVYPGVQTRLVELSKLGKGMQVILLALTQISAKYTTVTGVSADAAEPGNFPSHLTPDELHRVHEAILNWLLSEVATSSLRSETFSAAELPTGAADSCTDIATKLWEQPPYLLAKVSERHFDFFKVYMQYLIRRTEELDATTSITRGAASWEKDFEMIVSHFQVLIVTAEHVRDVCTSLVGSRVPETEKSVFTLKAKAHPHVYSVWSKLYLQLMDKPCTL